MFDLNKINYKFIEIMIKFIILKIVKRKNKMELNINDISFIIGLLCICLMVFGMVISELKVIGISSLIFLITIIITTTNHYNSTKKTNNIQKIDYNKDNYIFLIF